MISRSFDHLVFGCQEGLSYSITPRLSGLWISLFLLRSYLGPIFTPLSCEIFT